MKRTALLVLLVVALGGLAIVLLTPRGRAQVNVTVEPSMTRGSATAPVMIVEFSDYE